MLNRVRILNFKSIKELDLEIGKFTVIVGPTDSGKSAFLDSIKALCEDRRGQEYVRIGTTKTSVVLDFDDGGISWGKNNTAHYYKYAGKDYVGLVEIPSDIKEFLKLSYFKTQDVKLWVNFDEQLEPCFLYGISGGKIAKMIGKFSGISLLFLMISLEKQKLAKLKKSVEECNEQLKLKQAQLSKFDSLLRLEVLFNQIEDLFLVSNDLKEEQVNLFKLICNYTSLKEKLIKFNDCYGRIKDGVFDFSFIDSLFSNRLKYKSLISKVLIIEKYSILLQKSANLCSIELEGEFNILQNNITIYKKLKDILKKLTIINTMIKDIQNKETINNNNDTIIKKEIEIFIQKTPNCDRCGNLLSKGSFGA